MEIIGNGMVARSLMNYREQFQDVVIFASGVSNSLTADDLAYEREYTHLYQALRSCIAQDKRIVYFSSGGAIYGPTQDFRGEATPVYPLTKYGRHKLFCETIIRNSGARHLILRLANLVGQSSNASQLIPALIKQARHGNMTLYSEATRDLLDVEDFAHILACLLENYHENDLIVIASGYSIPILDIVNELVYLLDAKPTLNILSGGEPQRFNLGKLKGLLPDHTNFEADYYKFLLRKYVNLYDVSA